MTVDDDSPVQDWLADRHFAAATIVTTERGTFITWPIGVCGAVMAGPVHPSLSELLREDAERQQQIDAAEAWRAAFPGFGDGPAWPSPGENDERGPLDYLRDAFDVLRQ